MSYAECPNCDQMVLIGPKPRIGQKVECKNCKIMLEVSWLDPIELDWPYKPNNSDFGGYNDFEDDEYDYEDEEYEDSENNSDYDNGEED